MREVVFCFEPFCYLSISHTKIIVYNELDNQFYKYKIDDSISMKIIDNRYIIFCEDDLLKKDIKNFIHFFVNNNCAKLVKLYNNQLPFIQKRELFNEQKYIIHSNKIPRYSNDIIKAIFLIGTGASEYQSFFSKQIPFPQFSNTETFSDSTVIKKILTKLPYTRKTLFFIVSNNIDEINFLYTKIKDMKNIIIRTTYSTYLDNKEQMPANCKIELILSYPYEFDKNCKYNYLALIKDQQELDYFLNNVTLNNNFRLIPINISPETNNPLLSLDEDDIINSKQSIRKILFKKLYNISLFGFVYIFPSGAISDSLNSNSIGNIKEVSSEHIIENLLSNSSAWLLTRRKVNPCKNCLYCDFCSPISEYERSVNNFSICKGKLYEEK